MLRWFLPDDLGYPDFGFDVYGAFVGDVLPFRFDNAVVADLAGQRRAWSTAASSSPPTTPPACLSSRTGSPTRWSCPAARG